MSQLYFHLPELLSGWPYERQLNSHYSEVSKASISWIASYGLFTRKTQRAFHLYDTGLLVSLAYPYANEAHLRILCDGLNLVILYDDYSELHDLDVARRLADTVMDALRNPSTPSGGEHALFGEITRSFWLRALETISPSCGQRFVEAFEQYIAATVQQAEDRSRGYVRDMDSYMSLRRDTVAAKLGFAFFEHDYEFPHHVLNDPTITKLTEIALDLIGLCNDAYSFNNEQARGDDTHNMVTCIMDQKKVDIEEAMTVLQSHTSALTAEFLATRDKVPHWTDEIDAHVTAYIDGLGIWVRANDSWSFECQRYFGAEGLAIQKHRLVTLRRRDNL